MAIQFPSVTNFTNLFSNIPAQVNDRIGNLSTINATEYCVKFFDETLPTFAQLAADNAITVFTVLSSCTTANSAINLCRGKSMLTNAALLVAGSSIVYNVNMNPIEKCNLVLMSAAVVLVYRAVCSCSTKRSHSQGKNEQQQLTVADTDRKGKPEKKKT